MKQELDDRIRECLSYDAVTGTLRWLVDRHYGRFKAGSIAGSRSPKCRYGKVYIDGVYVQAHRVAWFLHHGTWPKGELDHEDGDKFNNRITNLRESTHGQNMHNKPTPKNNTSGVKGVYFNKVTEKWQASIKADGRSVHVGCFTDLGDAKAAVTAKRLELHGEFANNN